MMGGVGRGDGAPLAAQVWEPPAMRAGAAMTPTTSTTATATGARPVVVDNALHHYYDELSALLRRSAASAPSPADRFDPGAELPPLDDRLSAFFAPSTITWTPLDPAGGGPGGDADPAGAPVALSLLDLRGNPATRTTKTNPSLLMVARAAAHIHRTGEPIVIVTPSSANKATALRDAVWCAIDTGLVGGDQLRIVSVVPPEARSKLWGSDLDAQPGLRRRNPVAVHLDHERVGVKALVADLAEGDAAALERQLGVRLWFTLDLANYRVADAVRAFVELDHLPPVPPGRRRLHAHAVSSAFGLLGHAYGRRHRGDPAPPVGYFLVQHLATPDMVLELCTGSFDRSGLPPYRHDPGRGLLTQTADPRFPLATYAVDEVLDPTFYTHRPATQPAMRGLIEEHGGGGIVVSLHECLARYGEVRHRVAAAGISLPADPRQLQEWSLIMVMTGILEAVDRGLIDPGTEVVVHASGSYAADDHRAPHPDAVTEITEGDLAAVVTAAARA
jgi:uncharacterized protein DUF6002